MPGDYSRKIFNTKKHYSGVLMQQGRVQLDADWNEQLDIQLYRTETEAKDVIGLCGVPKQGNGFKIGKTVDGKDLTITPGRIYVGGLLCELENQASYTAQPHFPNPDYTSLLSSPPSGSAQLNLSDGTYLVFIDAWKREITALDDHLIREVALGGPDTTTRLQNIWQVKLLPVGMTSPPSSPPSSPPNGEVNCKSSLPEFDLYTALSTGMLNARTVPPEDQKNLCLLPPSAGYSRLENQLYRVEIHKGGTSNVATFKWSRENASVETSIEKIDGDVITVADIGKDDVLGFAGSQWVEIVDEASTLKAMPPQLIQIDKVDPATREITLKASAAAFENLANLKLRRWDQTGVDANTNGVKVSLSNWIELEGGIQINFSQGTYHTGDYWLIPARTATGEIEWPPYKIPNTNPIPQLPIGIRHYYCRLALIEVKGGVITKIEDCRKRFPSLTEICAEDVCFDNTHCDMEGAETVQDALDRLCEARDLRFHNKHLHGWGIVCGLQVNCGPDPLGQPRRHVTVRKGYAIDCEGNDILLDKEQQIDLIDLIEENITLPPLSPPSSPISSPLSSPPTGFDIEVCLVLETDGKQQPRFRVEPYPQSKNKFQSLLEGTLLMDVYNDCIKSLVDFFQDEFTSDPGEEKVPVGPTQKRLTTFFNLIIQLINQENGAFVFLSGEKGSADKNFEDTILRNFYNKLRAKLQSHTFCAMFEGARQFPDYPYSGLGIATIFGKGFQKRLRVSPNSKIAYSVGAGNKINVYDLEKNEMAVELEFPGGSSAIVQDVAFSKDGRQLYAVATLNEKDTMFAVADVSGLDHVFRKPTVICDVLLVTLGTSPITSENVYAIGKGKGLYEINPQSVNATPTPKYAFNAVGHLAIADSARLAFATATDQSSSDKYNRVLRLNLAAPDSVPPTFILPNFNNQQLFGDDDIALVFESNQQQLYVVASGNTGAGVPTKYLVSFNANNANTTSGITDLEEDTAIRLAYNPVTKFMMATYEDSYRVRLLDPNTRLIPGFRQPVQVSPLSIAVSPDKKRVYVLNYASNTISAIPSDRFTASKQIPLQSLVDYRSGVLEAFADLLAGLLQYLKDCFCDHFLVNCPTCDEDDKIYLACISIKNGQVFKVCNFSLRKYVKSFPTVEYWLSVVPIIPLIKKAIEKICCAVLPNFFGRFTAPKPDTSGENEIGKTNTLSSAQMRNSVTFIQQADLRSTIFETVTKAMTSKSIFFDFLGSTAKQTFAPQPQKISYSDVAGQPVGSAEKTLQSANIIVDKVESYDPNKGTENLIAFTAAPLHLEEGTRVKLITKDDKVLFYAKSEGAGADFQNLRTEFEISNKTLIDQTLKMQAELNSLKGELLQVRQTHTEELATRDKVIADLKAGFTESQEMISQLSSRMEKLSPPKTAIKRSKPQPPSKEDEK
ncbi:MAG: DUF6519 domain-containing protein [Acidobacteriota bacterium]